MNNAMVGSRYQVVIPKAVRQKVNLKPATKVRVEARNKTIVIYPASNTSTLRGLGLAVADGNDAAAYVKRLRAEWEH